MLLALEVYIWQQHFHSAGAFAAQNIGLVLHDTLLCAEVVLDLLSLLWALPVVEDGKLGA